MNDHSVMLEARDLSKDFSVRARGWLRRRVAVHAVESVSLTLRRGHVCAVVGESGSGKSVLARMLARTVRPSSGQLFVEGQEIAGGTPRDLAYAAVVQMVLQDPFASVNPVHPVRHCIERALRLHGAAKDDLEQRCEELLSRVALTPPEQFLDRYPHELSGGQLQRISIARALSVHPSVLLADEPISMLDVSVRLGVLNLLRELCSSENLAVLYITHDIASARYIADEIVVMYAGQVVERSLGTTVVDNPQHPYTRLLVSSVPDPDKDAHIRERSAAPAHVAFPTVGCRFAPRCASAMDRCRSESPPSFAVGDSHEVRCWLHAGASAGVELTLSTKKGGGE